MGLYETMGIMSASMASMMMLPIVGIGILIPLTVYLVARWRDRNEHADNPDRQIGLKVALHLFRVITFQLSLAGIFTFLLGIISDAPTEEFVRIGLGLAIPGVGLCFLHTLLIQRTNDHAYRAVGRMFEGWNMIITGLPGMIAVVALFVVVLFPHMAGARGDALRMVFPYLLTYGGAWALLGYRWFQAAGLIAQAPPGAGSIPPAGYGGYGDPGQGGQPGAGPR
jgi:hypothetical protein